MIFIRRNLCGRNCFLLPRRNFKYFSSLLRPSQNNYTYCSQYQYELNELTANLKFRMEDLAKNLSAEKIDSQAESIETVINCFILANQFGLNIENDTVYNFLSKLETNVRYLTPDNIISALVALNLSNIPLHHPVNRQLTIRVINLLAGN